MADPLSLSSNDTVVQAEDLKPIEPGTTPGRVALQALAGIGDMAVGAATSLPGMIGGIGKGTYRTIINDKGFMQNVGESIQEGVSGALIDAGERGVDTINKTLGVSEPTNTLEQIARFGSGFFVPGSWLAKMPKALSTAAFLMSPMVKYDKPLMSAARFATQGGIGVGGVTLMRSILDNPDAPPIVDLVPNEEPNLSVSAGTDAGDSIVDINDLQPIPNAAPGTTPDTVVDVNDLSPIAAPRAADDIVSQETRRNEKLGLAAVSGLALLIAGGAAIHIASRRRGRLDDGDGQLAAKKTLTEQAVLGPDRAGARAMMARRIGERGVDRIKTVENAVREAGEQRIQDDIAQGRLGTDEDVAQARLNLDEEVSRVSSAAELARNSPDYADRHIWSGEFPIGFGMERLATPFYKLVYDIGKMVPSKQQVWNDGMKAIGEHNTRIFSSSLKLLEGAGDRLDATTRTQLQAAIDAKDAVTARGIVDNNLDLLNQITDRIGYEKPGLWKHRGGERIGPVEDPDMYARINALLSDPEIAPHIDAFKRQGDALLDSWKRLGLITDAQIERFRATHTFEWNGQRRTIYVPGVNKGEPQNVFRDFENLLGEHSEVAREMHEVNARNLEHGQGITQPVNPLEAMEQAIFHYFDFGNRYAIQNETLEGIVRVSPETHMVMGSPAERLAAIKRGAEQNVHYVGHYDPDAQTGDTITLASRNIEDPTVRSKFFAKGVVSKSHPVGHPNVIEVPYKGIRRLWYVDDPYMLNTMRYMPVIAGNPATKFLTRTKRLMVDMTVGKFTPFPFISALYTTQNMAITRSARAIAGKDFAGRVIGPRASLLQTPGITARTFVDTNIAAAQSTYRVFMEKWTREQAMTLSGEMARIGRAGERIPEHMYAKQREIEAKMREYTDIHTLQREAGTAQAGFGVRTEDRSLIDVIGSAVPAARQMYGAAVPRMMSKLWRTWKYVVSSLHEGPVIAFALRDLKNLSPELARENPVAYGREVRRIMRNARTEGADTRRVGSSQAAEVAQLTVPFFGAMVQAWHSLAKAASGIGLARFSTLVATGIGLPTVAEVAWNTSLGDHEWVDAEGRKWTYASYYWHGFTTQQRVNNHIFFIPGLPPWRAQVVPTFPEWSLARAVVLSGLDGMFSLSTASKFGPLATGEPGHHLWEAVQRVFDIPLWPVAKAALSYKGMDVRAGPASADEPSFLNFVSPISARVTGGSAQVRSKDVVAEENKVFSQPVQNMIEALLGTSAKVLVDAFESAYTYSERGAGEAVAAAGHELVQGAASQLKLLNAVPILPQALRPKLIDETARSVLAKTNVLTQLQKMRATIQSGGRVRNLEGKPRAGLLDTTKDPVIQAVAANAGTILESLGTRQEQIADLRAAINEIRVSSQTPDRVPYSPGQRQQIINEKTIMIRELRAQQAEILRTWEWTMSKEIGDQVGRPLNIKFDRLQDTVGVSLFPPSSFEVQRN